VQSGVRQLLIGCYNTNELWLQRTGRINKPLRSADYEAWLKASMSISSPFGSRRITVLKLDDRIIAARLSNVDQVRVKVL